MSTRRSLRRALTLLELLLALGLITLVSSMMFIFYETCLRSREAGAKAMNDGYLARFVADKIADEIRSANGFLMNTGPGITGTERMITIQTVKLPDKELFYRRQPTDPLPPGQCDVRQVQYYLAYDDETGFEYPDGSQGPKPLGLVRREIRTPYQTSLIERPDGAHVDLFAPEILYLRFRYFDGVDWVDRWDLGKAAASGTIDPSALSDPSKVSGGDAPGNALPQAVEVTVGYAALPPKEVEEEQKGFESDMLPALPEPYDREKVTVLIRLEQADVFFGSRLMRAQREMAKSSETTGAPTQ